MKLGQNEAEDVVGKVVGAKGDQAGRQLGTSTGHVVVHSAKGERGDDLL